METIQFDLVLQVISTGLVKKIITEQGLDEDTAMERLYTSALYAANVSPPTAATKIFL